jgi:hypothetical protein
MVAVISIGIIEDADNPKRKVLNANASKMALAPCVRIVGGVHLITHSSNQ